MPKERNDRTGRNVFVSAPSYSSRLDCALTGTEYFNTPPLSEVIREEAACHSEIAFDPSTGSIQRELTPKSFASAAGVGTKVPPWRAFTFLSEFFRSLRSHASWERILKEALNSGNGFSPWRRLARAKDAVPILRLRVD
jgi:hypothetical protein